MAFDDGFELLPAADSLTADSELTAVDAALEPAGDPVADDSPRVYGRGWAFDFVSGQFTRGGNSPLEVTGLAQLRMWIEKTLRTARMAHPIYSDDYGIDQPYSVIGQPFTPGAAGRYARAISDALLVHDRITQIKDMTFTGGPNDVVLAVSFTVVTDEEEATFEDIPIGRTL
jgi:hypothetical protein